MQRLSASEAQRNLQSLNEFDVLEVVDKNRNQVKGYFLDNRYKALIEELLDKRKASRKSRLGLAGCANGSGPDLTIKQLHEEHLKKYEYRASH